MSFSQPDEPDERLTPGSTVFTDLRNEASFKSSLVSADLPPFSAVRNAMYADAPEFDLGDEEPAEENAGGDRVSETVDYSGKNKEQLLAIFETLLRTKPVQTIRADVEAIKIAFYKNYRNEVDQLRKLFVESGGNSEDFVPPANEAEQQFKTLFAEYREKRNEFIARLDAEKEANYQTKLQIIEELKELVKAYRNGDLKEQ